MKFLDCKGNIDKKIENLDSILKNIDNNVVVPIKNNIEDEKYNLIGNKLDNLYRYTNEMQELSKNISALTNILDFSYKARGIKLTIAWTLLVVIAAIILMFMVIFPA